MSEVEKQESQKTVVAFITGLLIGGLLVWVFSSTPDTSKDLEVTIEDNNTEEVADNETTTTKTETETQTKAETIATPEPTTVVGEGSLTVQDQSAGPTVALEAVKVPTESGWVVVRDYMDGVPGNILGAARYNVNEGLMPKSVDLVRSTTAGGSYQVVFYTNEGDISFTPGIDRPIDGVATTFKAN